MQTSRWYKLGTAIVLAALCAACAVFASDQDSSGRESVATPTLSFSEIENMARLELPECAGNLHVYYLSDGIDDFILLRFTLPPSDLEQFLLSSGYPQELQDYEWPMLSTIDEIPWWPKMEDYQAVEDVFFSGYQINEPGYARKILVEKTNPGLFIIFLEHFEI